MPSFIKVYFMIAALALTADQIQTAIKLGLRLYEAKL